MITGQVDAPVTFCRLMFIEGDKENNNPQNIQE